MAAVLAIFTAIAVPLIDTDQPRVNAEVADGLETDVAARYGLISMGEYYSCAVKLGDLYCWGALTFDTMYAPTRLTYPDDPGTPADESLIPFDEGTIIDLSVGGSLVEGTACAITDDGVDVGAIWCWGSNDQGEFGIGTTEPNDPIGPLRAFGNATGAVEVAVGGDHVCVLFDTGNVKCAGANDDGQLGDGTTTDSSTPVTVEYTTSGSSPTTGTLGSVTHLFAGYDHNCALLDIGGSDEHDPWCWGDNSKNELGYPSGQVESRALRPMLPPGMSSVVGLAIGAQSTGIWSSTNLWCVGKNIPMSSSDLDTPRLGTGSTQEYLFWWEDVTAFDGAPKALAMASTHTCALREDGTVRCWGENRDGFLGDGTYTDNASGVETLVPAEIDVIVAGTANTCVSELVGRLWCWGSGTRGANGVGSSSDLVTPTAVDSGSEGWTYLTTPSVPGVAISVDSVVVDQTTTGPTDRTDSGDLITATYTVTNTGTAELSSVAVTDALVVDGDISCAGSVNNVIATLAVSTSVTCTGTYTLTQDDVDGGNLASTTTATASSPSTYGSDTWSATISREAGLELNLSAGTILDTDSPSNGAGDEGDTVEVTHTIINTGNVTITNGNVSNTLQPDTAITCLGGANNTFSSLTPGASTTCTLTHSITTAEFNGGSISTTGSVDGSAPTGVTAPTTGTDSIVVTFTPNTTTTTTSTTSTTSPSATSTTSSTIATSTTSTIATGAATTTTTSVTFPAPESLPSGTLTRSIVAPNTPVELFGSGYAPGETVTAATGARRPKILGITTADVSGAATVTVEFDESDVGTVTVMMFGAESGHGSQQRITVAAALPQTGANMGRAPVLLVAIALGALIALASRRRVIVGRG